MKVLVTGVKGQLGFDVVNELKEKNIEAVGVDIEDMDTCLKLTYKELKRMRDVKMTSSQLAAAKKQLIGQIGVASDNFENNALGMAKTYLHYHKYESSESVFHRIEALTAEQLLEVANEMFAEEYLSTLIYK
jgi:predicted Zn-dependent peptidase